MSLERCTSVSDQPFTSIPKVTVKFNIGEEKTLTLPFDIGTSTGELRKQLTQVLQIPSHELTLSHEGKCVTDDQTLADFATTRFGTIVMKLFTGHHIDVSRLCNQIYGDIEVKNVITVTVELGKGKEPKSISVEIIHDKQKKRFIGGFRHQLSGAEYHHASSQTEFQSDIAANGCERGSLTEPIKISKLEGMPGVVATQTPVAGLYVIEPLNKIMTAKRYVPVNELEIKRKCRQWLFKARLKSQGRLQESDESSEKQYMKHKSKVLFNELVPKEKDMKEYFSGILTIFSNKFMLMKEIDSLVSHEKMKNEAKHVYQKRVNLGIIKKFCKPYTWTSKSGHISSMETEYHREFCKWQKMYMDLLNEDLTVIERRQLILSIKETLEPLEECDYMTLQELLVQQLHLIDAGVKSKQLTTLQAITEKYFMIFLQDYAQKCFPKLQVDHISQIKSQVQTCNVCKKMRHKNSFKANSRRVALSKCKSCFWMANMNRHHVDYNIYRHMLESIWKEEEKHNCFYSIAFALQGEDIHYIVNTLWHGKSILSEDHNLNNLRLCRFDKSVQWSPWNCILVTQKEFLVHSFVDDPLEVSGSITTDVSTGCLTIPRTKRESIVEMSNVMESLTWMEI